MPSPNNVLTADSYIQDGLVFQLDGIDYGGRADGWLDRIEKIFFSSSDQSDLHVDNKFQFSNQRYLISNQAIGYTNPLTIDVTFAGLFGLNNVLLYFNAICKLFTLYSQNLYTLGRLGEYYRNGVTCFSARSTSFVSNGVRKPTKGGNDIALSVNSPQIAKAGSYYFTGSIYAIRIYSRQLSDREILINQKIDNARFELGLNIPDEVLPASRSLSLSEPFELPDESMTEHEPTNEPSDER